jgi:hypothetical protein
MQRSGSERAEARQRDIDHPREKAQHRNTSISAVYSWASIKRYQKELGKQTNIQKYFRGVFRIIFSIFLLVARRQASYSDAPRPGAFARHAWLPASYRSSSAYLPADARVLLSISCCHT